MTDPNTPAAGTPAPDAPAPPPPPYAGSPWAAPAPPAPPSRRRHHGGAGLGFFLVALGVVFLATQFVPGFAWWTLWPLLIVAGGLVQIVTPHHDKSWSASRAFDGIGTVLFGLVLLGNTTGYVSWSVWWVLVTLWPVLLIAIGLRILGKGLGQSWLRMLAPVAVWLALGYAVAVSLTGAGGLTPVTTQVQTVGQPFAFSEPLNGASQARLDFKGAAGAIAVKSGSDLIRAVGRSPYGAPQFTVGRGLASADVAMTLGNTNSVAVAPGFGAGSVDLALSSSALWDIALETGASSLDADLSDVNVRRLDVSTGVGSTTIKLGPVADDPAASFVRVKAGVASVTILVPKGSEAVVDTHGGLTGTSMGPEFVRRSDGTWQTPGYAVNGKAWHVSTESGIGSVSIRTY